MKYKIVTLLFIAASAFITSRTISDADGAAAGYAGDPGNGYKNCVTCHTGSAVEANSPKIALSFDNGYSEYLSGETYDMTITVSDPAFQYFGFELVPMVGTSTATAAGTITIDPLSQPEVKIQTGSGGQQYLTQTQAGMKYVDPNFKNTRSWKFKWTAPTDPNIKQVCFYIAGMGANKNNSSTGDKVYTKQVCFSLSPDAVVSGFTVNKTTVCSGETISCTDKALPANASNTYQWYVSGCTALTVSPSNTSTQANPNFTVSIGAGTVPCTATITQVVTAPGGGTTTPAIKVITINPVPSLDNVTVTPSAVCPGGEITIGESNDPTCSYTWNSIPAGSFKKVTNPPGLNPYTIIKTNKSTRCTTSRTVNAEVYFPPYAEASPNPGTDIVYTCLWHSSNPQIIKKLGTPALPNCTYTWDTRDPYLTPSMTAYSSAEPEIAPPDTLDRWYNLTVTDDHGCKSVDSVYVDVANPPLANAGFDQTICAGFSTSLRLGLDSAPLYSYLWSATVGGVFLTKNTDAHPRVSNGVNATYTMTVTNDPKYSCTNVDAVTVSVRPIPAAQAGRDTAVCKGSCTLLGNKNAASGFDYYWEGIDANGNSANNTIKAPSAAPTVMVCPTVTTTYIIRVSNQQSCSKYDSVRVVVNDPPTVDGGADKAICIGACVDIGAEDLPGNNYQWSPSGAGTPGFMSPSTGNQAIVTVCPTKKTTYTLKVTNATTGCSTQDVVVVDVGTKPQNINAGPDKIVCQGACVQIGTAAVAGYKYKWISSCQPGSYTINYDTLAMPTVCPLTVGTCAFTVVVTNLYGCTSSDFMVLTSKESPIADAGPDKSVCANGTVVIGTPPLPGTNNVYSWTPGTDISGSKNLAQVQAKPSASCVDYILTVTSGQGCKATDMVRVCVNPTPVANAGLDTSVCNGVVIRIGTPKPGGSGYKYKWTPNNFLSPDTDAMPTVNPPTTQSYVVVVTSPEGCTAKDGVKVSVRPSPTIVLESDKVGSTFCENDSIKYIASPGNFARYIFTLYTNPAIVQDSTISTFSLPQPHPSGELKVSVVGIAADGCYSNASNEIKKVFVPRLKAPEPACEGITPTSLTFSWKPVSGASGYQVSEDEGISWKDPSSGASGTRHAIGQLAPQQTRCIKIRATTTAPCNTGLEERYCCTTRTCPKVHFTLTHQDSVCIGDLVKFDFTNISANQYEIEINGVSIGQLTHYETRIYQPSSFDIKVYDKDEPLCFPTIQKVQVGVYKKPDAQFTPSYVTYDFPTGTRIWSFTDKSKDAASFFWDFGDGSTSTIQNEVHGYKIAGTVKVCLTVTSFQGCKDTSCKTINTLSLDKVSNPLSDVKVFPNPFNDELSLKLPSSFANMSVEVYSTLGVKVWEKEIKFADDQVDLNLTGLAEGVYTLTLRTKEYSYSYKLVKRKN